MVNSFGYVALNAADESVTDMLYLALALLNNEHLGEGTVLHCYTITRAAYCLHYAYLM
jgi:hypothetical protein